MRNAAAAALLCLVVCAAGCASWHDIRNWKTRQRYVSNTYPANPVVGLKTVGVLVLDASYSYKVDTLEFSRALHAHLQEIEGIEVVSDAAVLEGIRRLAAPGAREGPEEFALPKDSLQVADELKLDGLFVAIVTEYDPYAEPLVSLGLTLFSRAMPQLRRVDLNPVIAGGRPLPMPQSPSARPVTAVYAVYDASRRKVKERLRWFAEGHTEPGEGLSWERYYRVMPKYMSFVSYEIIWKLFERIERDIANAGELPPGAGARSPAAAGP